MKKLEEEREKTLKEAEVEADLGKNLEEGDNDGARLTSSENRGATGKSNSGDASDSYDRENRSYNESNSTSQKQDSQRDGVVLNGEREPKPEPERNELDPPRTESEPGKILDGEENETTVVREDNAKQSSDVQSSMSLSRKKRRRRGGAASAAGGGGSSSGEEPEGDEVSLATKQVTALKSEPLVKFLGTIRSHRLGSVFQRRLHTQVLCYIYFILFYFICIFGRKCQIPFCFVKKKKLSLTKTN